MSEEPEVVCGESHCALLMEGTMDSIAEKAADRAVKKLTNQIYQDVGKTVVQKFIWLVGVAALALWFWLQSKGIMKWD